MIFLAFLSEFHFHLEARSAGDGEASVPQGGMETPIVEFQGVGKSAETNVPCVVGNQKAFLWIFLKLQI